MRYFLFALLLLSTGCSAQTAVTTTPVTQDQTPPVVTDGSDVLYTCKYKYSSEYDVQFLESNRKEYHPESLPELLVYRIKDTKGKNWSINEYDWLNYDCSYSIIPKVKP